MKSSNLGLASAVFAVVGLLGCVGGEDAANLAVDRPFAYVKRDMPQAQQTYSATTRAAIDIRAPYNFNPGAQLLVADRIASDAEAVDILAGYFGGEYDVKDLDVSADGKQIIFAAHGPDSHPTDNSWNIYRYDFSSGEVTRLIEDDDLANAAHDTGPAFGNDGRIVFSSDRQAGKLAVSGQDITSMTTDTRQYILDFDEPASLLHTMAPDGSQIEQITYGHYHDVEPTAMRDGRFVYVRWGQNFEILNNCIVDSENPEFFVHPNGGGWGHTNGGDYPDGLSDPKDWSEEEKCTFASEVDGQAILVTDIYGMYRVSPTGANSHRYYGSSEPATDDTQFLQIIDPIEDQNGNLLSIVKHLYNPMFGGDVIEINTENFQRESLSVEDDTQLFKGGIERSISPGDVQLYPGQISPAGWYSALWPYDDSTGRLLTSWSQCIGTVEGEHAQCASEEDREISVQARYGLWAVDLEDNTRLPVVRPKDNQLITDIVIGQFDADAEKYQPSYADSLKGTGFGALHLHTAFDLDGVDKATEVGGIRALADPTQHDMTQRSERFVQVIAPVEVPADLQEAATPTQLFGAGNGPMWDILGYGRIEPDGSVLLKIPADQEFTFRIVNGYGKHIELLDSDSYLFSYLKSHPYTLRLEDGEVRECNGCHDAASQMPHGRFDIAPASANVGGVEGYAFPNTNTAIKTQYDYDTMAETLALYRGGLISGSGDMSYTDYWKPDGSTPVEQEARYAQLTTTLPLSESSCAYEWTKDCRVTINYTDHIQALWEVPRASIAGNSVPGPQHSCQGCHNKGNPDVANLGNGGDLVLTGRTDAWNPEHIESYVQLFNARAYYKYQNGGFSKVTATDPTEVCSDFVDPPYIVDEADGDICYARRLMSARGAIASANFFTLFDDDPDDDRYRFDPDNVGGKVDHRGWLTSHELKLIAEWLDTGAHYYNDPDAYPQ